jgi:hypothetical protein
MTLVHLICRHYFDAFAVHQAHLEDPRQSSVEVSFAANLLTTDRGYFAELCVPDSEVADSLALLIRQALDLVRGTVAEVLGLIVWNNLFGSQPAQRVRTH